MRRSRGSRWRSWRAAPTTSSPRTATPSCTAGPRSAPAPRRGRSTTPSCACSRSRARKASPATRPRRGWRSSGSPRSRRCGATLSEQILVGADHAGYRLKQRLVEELKRLGYEPVDVGPKALDPADDFPDYARPVAAAVSEGKVRRGVLTCGTGLGMAYVANRFPRVRAAVAWSPEIAELARKHNDANVLVLPARFVSEEEGMEILHKWLETTFEGGRHERRVAKIDQ